MLNGMCICTHQNDLNEKYKEYQVVWCMEQPELWYATDGSVDLHIHFGEVLSYIY